MAFREPPDKYARMTLSIVVALLAVILAGIAFRRCLRQTRDLRGAGEAVREVRHPHSSQRKPGAGHRGVADAARGKAEPQVQEFPVPGGELEHGAAGDGEGGVPLWGVVSSGSVYRGQPGGGRPGCGAIYNKRGTAEQWIKEGCQRHMRMPYLCQVEMWIKEGKQAVKMTRLSCHRFRSNEVRLWLSVIAYNLGNLWRRLVLPKKIDT
jgi:hypothetical protein